MICWLKRIILNQEGTAFISEIEDRKNYIIRRSSNLSKQSHILAANLDQCMLVVTINYPETSTIFIDRFLASAEAYRVPVKLVFNKVDAYDEDELRYLDALINLYTQRAALEWLKSKKHWKARLLYFPDIRESANRLLSIPYCRA